jgi:hypothetical protein
VAENPRAALLRKKLVEALRQYGTTRSEAVELFQGILADGLKLLDEAPEKPCVSSGAVEHSKGHSLVRGPRCQKCGGAMQIATDSSGKAEYRGCR